jgi:hypothetical protein
MENDPNFVAYIKYDENIKRQTYEIKKRILSPHKNALRD